MYYAHGDRYAIDSETNLKIRKLFVAREVKANVTDLVDYIFDTAQKDNAPPFTIADIQEEMEAICPDCMAVIEDVPCIACEEDLIPLMNDDPYCDPEDKYLCPLCSTPYATEAEAAECCLNEQYYQCGECGRVFSVEEYDEMIECNHLVREWWIVSPWLCDKLAEKGESVIKSHSIWGRCDTIEGVHKDDIIGIICHELGILDGQLHDWSKNLK